MKNQIVQYIKVLKDRHKLAIEYRKISIDQSDPFEQAVIDTLDDIIAELEGYVKAQERPPTDHSELEQLEDDHRLVPIIPSTGPALDTREGKGDYTKLMRVYNPTEEEWLDRFWEWLEGQ